MWSAITSGGVSAGQKDHLPGLLGAHGRIAFWKVRMKPGMPLLFGEWDRALFLCLPGNPVSTLATMLTLGRALLDGLQGRDDLRDLPGRRIWALPGARGTPVWNSCAAS